MDRTTMVEHLLQAQSAVEVGSRHIIQQRAIVERFGNRGAALMAARQLLATFEDLQKEHVAYRDRLAKELAALVAL